MMNLFLSCLFLSVTSSAFTTPLTSRKEQGLRTEKSSAAASSFLDATSYGTNVSNRNHYTWLKLFGSQKPSKFLPPSPEEEPQNRKNLSEQARFLRGEELDKLRSQIEDMKEKLRYSSHLSNRNDTIMSLKGAIERLENKDAEISYKKALDSMEEARYGFRTDDVERHRKEAMLARKSITRLNLEGLWVGDYGNGGYEMINVTYVGDTLIAKKTAGDTGVPRGEVTFAADLSFSKSLEPLNVTGDMSKRWGIDKLIRHPGKAQVAKEASVDTEWVDGQFIMFEDHFSFLWTHNKKNIFFSRPSMALTIKLLRDILSHEDEIGNMRAYLSSCLEGGNKAPLNEKHELGDPFKRIMTHSDIENGHMPGEW
eukprot:CAMPEP_0195513952 /NCGR_PEP_ID=MMETSP0794_2-20130614/5485_1 /TAXON_ID=515487 /ORGANISM="Stephanopyxis turris, Strain CCMP 815" /LENGTH=367 /DNA_ID=CAMNT_0040642089 /DNA_START=126 /DNA_END=1226 /DNA_ORIENTATION=+